MSKHTQDIIAALKSKDFHRAGQSFEAAIHEKLTARIGQERETLRLAEDASPVSPKKLLRDALPELGFNLSTDFDNIYRNIYRRVQRIIGRQPQREELVKCIQAWIAWSKTRQTGNEAQQIAMYRKALKESAPPPISHIEVQRVYDEHRDASETELICGIQDLKINEQGEVVSFVPKTVTEAKEQERCELCGSTKNLNHTPDGTAICKECDIEEIADFGAYGEHCDNPDSDPTDGKSKFVKEMAFGQPTPSAGFVKKVEELFAKVQKIVDDAHERQVDHHIAHEKPYDWEAGMTKDEVKKQLLSLNKRTITVKPRAKYINIDCGGSGQLMIDTTDGRIYGIKGYGQINKQHNWYGTVASPKLKEIAAKIVGSWNSKFIQAESLRVVGKLLGEDDKYDLRQRSQQSSAAKSGLKKKIAGYDERIQAAQKRGDKYSVGVWTKKKQEAQKKLNSHANHGGAHSGHK